MKVIEKINIILINRKTKKLLKKFNDSLKGKNFDIIKKEFNKLELHWDNHKNISEKLDLNFREFSTTAIFYYDLMICYHKKLGEPTLPYDKKLEYYKNLQS